MELGRIPRRPTTAFQYVHWDHLGSTRLVTDEMGVPLAAYKYYPFGQEAEYSDSVGNRMEFTGHERDREVGLDYMLARYYGAGLARFLSVDPVDDTSVDAPQSWNKFTYSRNSPLVLKDPDGRTVINGATDPDTHAALDNLATQSPIFQALMDSPDVVVNVSNINYPTGVCSDLMKDGGMARLQYDSQAGTTTIDVGIDPELAGAATSREPGSSVRQGSADAIDRLVRFEASLGVLAQADPAGTAEDVKAATGGHALAEERTDVANEMYREQRVAKTK